MNSYSREQIARAYEKLIWAEGLAEYVIEKEENDILPVFCIFKDCLEMPIRIMSILKDGHELEPDPPQD